MITIFPYGEKHNIKKYYQELNNVNAFGHGELRRHIASLVYLVRYNAEGKGNPLFSSFMVYFFVPPKAQ